MTRVLVTGASGFVGHALSRKLLDAGYAVTAAVREPSSALHSQYEQLVLREIDTQTPNWKESLLGFTTVFHLAARVHIINDRAADPLEAFRKANVARTRHLAFSAAEAGVKRFVFLSSIKVNGEVTTSVPFSLLDAAHPRDPYGISKWEAEQELQRISEETGMEVVIIRSPLVYGEGVKANFFRLLSWINKGIPLPLRSLQNRRSMIYIGNLVDALMLAAIHPKASDKIWLVSDGEDISTPDLIHKITVAMGRLDTSWPMFPSWLRLVGKVTGKSAEIERLLSSLQVDSSPFRQELGWQPPYTLEQGLKATVDWYLQSKTPS